jgi:hypothetical protein
MQNDLGFIFERGSTGDNAAIIWDESADVFVLGTTTATGASTGDLTVSQVGLHAGSITINSAYTFPTSDGTADQVLTTNGSGTLSFATISGGGSPGGSDTQVQFNDGGSFGGDAGLTYNKTTDLLTGVNITATGNVSLGDSNYLNIGAGPDLSIYHDGSNSYIDDVGTGSLFVRSGTTYFQNAAGEKTSISTNAGAGQSIYHNNALKLVTTATGIDVSGNIAVSGTVDGRDVATDGTKLDGIETGATADQTGAQIKTAYEAETNAFTDAQFTKLAGIETGATADQTGAQIKTAYEAETNAFTDTQFTKLAGIETGATADQTGAQIKTAYEAETNAFTDAQFTKLAGIETSADVTDATNVTAAGALMDSEVTNLAQVKAFDTTDYATAAQGALADSANQPATTVAKSSDTGSAAMPSGTTEQRDVSPSAGNLRFNSTDNSFEGYDGSAWGAIGGAAASSGLETVFLLMGA